MDMDMHTYWVDETKRNETKNKKNKNFQETTYAKIVALYPSKHPGKEEKERKKKKRKMDRFNNMSQGDQ